MAPFFCHYNFYQNRKIVPGFLSHYVNSVSRSTSTYIFCHMTYLNHLMVFFYACKYFTSINHALSNRISKDNHISCWSSIYWILIRYLMVSTDQADSRCFYSRMSWILMERHWFYFFCSLHLCLVLLQVPKCFVLVQIFWANAKIWLHLVPLQKLLCWHKKTILLNANHLFIWHKMFVTATICK